MTLRRGKDGSSTTGWLLSLAVVAYQVIARGGRGHLGQTCRFEPSCSSYAIGALREWGAVRGSWLAMRRLGRCHPWGGVGVDPVPSRSFARAGVAAAPPTS